LQIHLVIAANVRFDEPLLFQRIGGGVYAQLRYRLGPVFSAGIHDETPDLFNQQNIFGQIGTRSNGPVDFMGIIDVHILVDDDSILARLSGFGGYVNRKSL